MIDQNTAVDDYVQDAHGNPVTDASGHLPRQQAAVKSLGAAILAGALSRMLAQSNREGRR